MLISFLVPGLAVGSVGTALVHGWEPLLRDGAPPHRLTMGPVQKSQTTSEKSPLDRITRVRRTYETVPKA